MTSAQGLSEAQPGTTTSPGSFRFQRIVVGTDFSDPASEALRLATAIAAIFGAEVRIVHAVSPFVYGPETAPVPPELLQENLDSARADLNQTIAADAQLRHLHATTAVSFADPVELISRTAGEVHADLIVVGSHGARGLERLALGSVAESLLRRGERPVLVVGPQCRSSEDPFRSILFATDLARTGVRAAQLASALVEKSHGRLTILHVAESGAPATQPEAEDLRARMCDQMKELVSEEAKLFCRPTVRVDFGVPGEVIARVARSECASLVVVGTGARSLLAEHAPCATLSRVIRDSSCGVLAVPR